MSSTCLVYSLASQQFGGQRPLSWKLHLENAAVSCKYSFCEFVWLFSETAGIYSILRQSLMQSLMTRCVKSLCLSFVFHLLPPLFTLCPSSCPEGAVLPLCPVCSPTTHMCDLWTSVLPPLCHFISSLFCLVIPGGEADPHL